MRSTDRGPGRPRTLNADEELELVCARTRGEPWKALQQRFGLGRTQLHEAYKRGLRRVVTVCRVDLASLDTAS